MRDIKFRAWDTAMGVMRNVNALGWKSNTVMLETGTGTSARCTFGNVTLMQFTGLKDKNGKEIYEGDIVLTKTGVNFPILKQPVEWMANDAKWSIGGMYPHEVIGNIYENPDLFS